MRGPLQQPTLYDIQQEQMRHDDAIGWFGEMTCFLHWWRIEDFEAGLVERCSLCYLPLNDITAAYRQPAQQKCPQCYGSTFEGGFAYIWYRPALWTTTPQSDDVELRGDVKKVNGTIEFSSDLSLTDGDIVVRADNSRWKLDQPSWQEISTGFGSQQGVQTKRLRGSANVRLEAIDAIVYLPAVDLNVLAEQGWRPSVRIPHPLDQDFTDGTEIPNQGQGQPWIWDVSKWDGPDRWEQW